MNIDDTATFLTVLIVGVLAASLIGASLAVALARRWPGGAWVISGEMDPDYVPPSTSLNPAATVPPMTTLPVDPGDTYTTHLETS
jgi:hypothetical protein